MINTEFDRDAEISSCIQSIPKDLLWCDLACSFGYYSKIILEHGAKSVIAIDVREEFRQSNNDINGVTFHIGNLDNVDTVYPLIDKVDAVLYAGHLYHTLNHISILQMITNTTAKHLVLESKSHNLIMSGSNIPAIYFGKESSAQHYLKYDPNNTMTEIGQPNLLWITTTLVNLGWTVSTVNVGKQVSILDGKTFIIYVISASR